MKYYILCEGSKDKSEYNFIQRIKEEFGKNLDVEIESAGGNKNIQTKFFELYDNFKSGDMFILFFDCVEQINNISSIDLLENIENKCRSKNVLFKYSTYYCFEELFLSYIGFGDLISKNSKYYSEWVLIRDALMSKTNYFVKGLLFNGKPVNKSFSTREAASAGIISTLSSGGFKITKDTIGDCWVYTCSTTNVNSYICDKCKFRKKGCTFKEKLDDID